MVPERLCRCSGERMSPRPPVRTGLMSRSTVWPPSSSDWLHDRLVVIVIETGRSLARGALTGSTCGRGSSRDQARPVHGQSNGVGGRGCVGRV